MRYIVITFILSLLSIFNGLSTVIGLDTTLINDCKYCYCVDSVIINNKNIDSIFLYKFNGNLEFMGNSEGINYMPSTKELFSIEFDEVNMKGYLYSLNIVDRIVRKKSIEGIYIVGQYIYNGYREDKKSGFELINLISEKSEYKSNYFDVFPDRYIGGFLTFPKSDTVLFYYGYPDASEYSYVKNYLYDIKANKIINELKENNIAYYLDHQEYSNAEILIKRHLLSIDGNGILAKDFLIFRDFTYVKVLDKTTNMYGFNFQKDKLQYYYIKSDDRNGERVLVPFRPKTNLELLFKKLYDNELVSKSNFSELDKHDMFLAKNLIYAKHNINFKSEFLYAFFNIYSFYRNSSEEKLDNVDHLLTPTDKQNLKIIEARIKELESN